MVKQTAAMLLHRRREAADVVNQEETVRPGAGGPQSDGDIPWRRDREHRRRDRCKADLAQGVADRAETGPDQVGEIHRSVLRACQSTLHRQQPDPGQEHGQRSEEADRPLAEHGKPHQSACCCGLHQPRPAGGRTAGQSAIR
jgi:hypothetical protein